jgi:hypothetical protein
VDWEGYLNLPDDLTHYEIIDGEVIPLASPQLRHQIVSAELLLTVAACRRAQGVSARLLIAPYDLWCSVRRAHPPT